MTELEKVAIFAYWKEIGNRIGIKDIPDALEDLSRSGQLNTPSRMCTSPRIIKSAPNRPCDYSFGIFLPLCEDSPNMRPYRFQRRK
jgi:hypothetical protein